MRESGRGGCSKQSRELYGLLKFEGRAVSGTALHKPATSPDIRDE